MGMSNGRMQMYVPVIRKFAARLVLFHASVAAARGLNVTDVHSLRLLGENSLSAGELSEQLGLTGAAVTALIDRLEEAGYVERERDTEDRRRVTVRAKPMKLRAINALYADQGARMEKLLSRYSQDEFRVIVDFLERTTDVVAEGVKKLKREQ
jgi:DNA-binding MarR family transcriptional regulator